MQPLFFESSTIVIHVTCLSLLYFSPSWVPSSKRDWLYIYIWEPHWNHSHKPVYVANISSFADLTTLNVILCLRYVLHFDKLKWRAILGTFKDPYWLSLILGIGHVLGLKLWAIKRERVLHTYSRQEWQTFNMYKSGNKFM